MVVATANVNRENDAERGEGGACNAAFEKAVCLINEPALESSSTQGARATAAPVADMARRDMIRNCIRIVACFASQPQMSYIASPGFFCIGRGIASTLTFALNPNWISIAVVNFQDVNRRSQQRCRGAI